MSRLPPSEALRALAEALAPFLAPLITGASPRPYSQRDGELPPGARRVKFLRTWRRAHAAGDAGAWAEGRARLMSPEAWARWSRRAEPPVTSPAAAAPSLLDDLGGKRVAS